MATQSGKQTSRFLNIPAELRAQIYSYVLPYTLKASRDYKKVVWIRGSTTLLQVCRQVHDECADILYGCNAFQVDIKYDSIRFHYTWLIPSGLMPKSMVQFPSYLDRNIHRIKNYVINVEHVDSYSGQIKYNCAGPGLTAGVQNQVRTFVNMVRHVGSFGRIVVRLNDGNMVLSEIRRPGLKVHLLEKGTNTVVSQTVLNPFRYMNDVSWAEVSGLLDPKYASEIERAMTGKEAYPAEASLAVSKNNDVLQDPAVLWRWKNSWNA